MFAHLGVILVVLLSVALYFFYKKVMPAQRSSIPSHLLSHPVHFEEGLISKSQAEQVMDLILNRMVSFPSNIAADRLTGVKSVRLEHMGEAKPVDAETHKCAHELMTPHPSYNKAKNETTLECRFPQRVDIGRHFILTGGADAKRERVSDLIDRVTSFGRYYLKDTNMPELLETSDVVKSLFEDKSFLSAAAATCPPDKQQLDPFQFNIIIQVPGQTVAHHIDAPYFFGANRKDLPQYLLAVMVFSGLWQQEFIDQVQLVVYLSDIKKSNTNKNEDVGGQFIYYDQNRDGQYKEVPAHYLAGSSVDGSKLIHASKIYQPSIKPPHLDKDQHSELKYDSAKGVWKVFSGSQEIKEYQTSDLRISMVYRARCFTDLAEVDQYYEMESKRGQQNSGHFEIEDVLGRLQRDLVDTRGYSQTHIQSLSREDLGMLLIDEYIAYPLPPSTVSTKDEDTASVYALFRQFFDIPYNYCVLEAFIKNKAPFLSALADYIC